MERRRAQRVRLGPIQVRLSGIPGTLIDLSVLGALVQLQTPQVADTSVALVIEAALPLDLQARVIRSAPTPYGHLIALEFEDLSMEVLTRLSRLVDQPVEHEDDDTPTTISASLGRL